jgi:hypothetical protein
MLRRMLDEVTSVANPGSSEGGSAPHPIVIACSDAVGPVESLLDEPALPPPLPPPHPVAAKTVAAARAVTRRSRAFGFTLASFGVIGLSDAKERALMELVYTAVQRPIAGAACPAALSWGRRPPKDARL